MEIIKQELNYYIADVQNNPKVFALQCEIRRLFTEEYNEVESNIKNHIVHLVKSRPLYSIVPSTKLIYSVPKIFLDLWTHRVDLYNRLNKMFTSGRADIALVWKWHVNYIKKLYTEFSSSEVKVYTRHGFGNFW
jgi:hypothetical protein